jgi:hypothetical protein
MYAPEKYMLDIIKNECKKFLTAHINENYACVVLQIPMGTNCAPLLADLFLYSYEADFIQRLLKKNEKKLARSFILSSMV